MSIASVVLRGFGNGTVVGSIGLVARQGFAAYIGLVDPPPAGKQYFDVGGLPWGVNEISWLANASPAVANGDIMIVDTVTTPDSYAITMSPTGVITYVGLNSTARQSAQFNVYDVSVAGFYGAVTDYVNNHPPALGETQNFGFTYYIGAGASTIDLTAYYTDFENDTITYSVSPTSPNPATGNFALAGSVITITPSTVQTTPITFRATDSIGDFNVGSDLPFTFTVAPTPAAPVLTGATIPNQGYLLNSGVQVFDTSVYATGQFSQSISPALPTGASFDQVSGFLTIDTAVIAAGTYGAFTVNYTNPGGNVNSNTFSIVASATPLISLPNFAGLSEATADSQITGLGLSHNSSHDLFGYKGAFTRGIVIGQSPVATTPVAAGTEIILTISLGPLTFLAIKK